MCLVSFSICSSQTTAIKCYYFDRTSLDSNLVKVVLQKPILRNRPQMYNDVFSDSLHWINKK